MLKKISIAALMAVVVSGCASGDGSSKINISDLNDPATTPIEKWSDALRYMDAMGVYGMRDVPREMFDSTASQTVHNGASFGALDAATFGLSAASPPTGISSGAALGVGFGLMLLSGPAQPVQVTQVAAWVPSDLASSPEDAAKLVERIYNEAREQVFVKKLPQDISLTKYPAASGLAFGKKFPTKNNLILFSEPAKESPWFITAPKSYGPIFIKDHKLSQEFSLNTKGLMNLKGVWEKTSEFSAALPEWFLIYTPAKSVSKTNKLPPVVFRSGAPSYFIGK